MFLGEWKVTPQVVTVVSHLIFPCLGKSTSDVTSKIKLIKATGQSESPGFSKFHHIHCIWIQTVHRLTFEQATWNDKLLYGTEIIWLRLTVDEFSYMEKRSIKHLISRIFLQNDVSHNNFVVPSGNYKI